VSRFVVRIVALTSLLAFIALPARAHSEPIDISGSCPASTPSAGFTDIAGLGATTELAINCLVVYEITHGVTPTTYSPNTTVARWQMALFLVRQAEDHGIAVPPPSNQGFTDIADLPQEAREAVNKVAAMGLSSGTTATTFEPNQTVTRWQMALFLYRLAQLAGITVVDDPTGVPFTDIGGFSNEIQAAINFLADGHIALGTSEGVFSPNSPVVRWQMALFLARVLAADGVTPPA
jgi:hypothetical protein